MSTTEQLNDLAKILRTAREGLNMSVEESAKVSEVNSQYIVALEEGDVRFPAPHVLFALSSVYAYPYEKLMFAAGHLRKRPLSGKLRAPEHWSTNRTGGGK